MESEPDLSFRAAPMLHLINATQDEKVGVQDGFLTLCPMEEAFKASFLPLAMKV